MNLRRSIYVPQDDWDMWQREAARLGGVLGRSVSVSELVRDAVAQAIASYGRGDEQASRAETAQGRGPACKDPGRRRQDAASRPETDTPATAEDVGGPVPEVEGVATRPFRPVPKPEVRK